MNIEMGKTKFLELLDKVVYGEEKKKILNTLIEEAIKKWKYSSLVGKFTRYKKIIAEPMELTRIDLESA
jgi:hypothetical protein